VQSITSKDSAQGRNKPCQEEKVRCGESTVLRGA